MARNYLDNELRWFRENLKDLLEKHPEKWVVVYHQQVIGGYDSFQEAYRAGVVATGSEEILVKQVTEKEEPREPSINLALGFLNG